MRLCFIRFVPRYYLGKYDFKTILFHRITSSTKLKTHTSIWITQGKAIFSPLNYREGKKSFIKSEKR